MEAIKYGRLTVIGDAPKNKYGMKMVICKCDCGNEITTRLNCLKRGETNSCGCLRKELSVEKGTKHGFYGSPTYRSWTSMKTRCHNSTYKRFNDYGGRGIKFCDDWVIFENFLRDMGERPDGTTLDRIDNNGDYCKDNCRWSTPKTQRRNMRLNRIVATPWGEITVAEASEKSGIKESVIRSRLNMGWTDEDLFLPPYRCDNRKWEGKTKSDLAEFLNLRDMEIDRLRKQVQAMRCCYNCKWAENCQSMPYKDCDEGNLEGWQWEGAAAGSVSGPPAFPRGAEPLLKEAKK